MFITQNTTVLGGRGFSVGGGGGVLKTASGYPLTLKKTLAKPMESVTVYGNTGGVGERINLFNPADTSGWGKNLEDDGTEVSTGNIAYSGLIAVQPDTLYTFTAHTGGVQMYQRVHAYDENGNWIKMLTRITALANRTVTNVARTTASTRFVRVTIQRQYTNIMVLEGSYSPTTIPRYMSYSTHQIPILLSDGTENKTINLYSDAALGANDSLTVNPKTQTAMRGSTNVKALQDWTQDFTIPKADEVTVTAGTTVQPEKLGVGYMSKDKAWRIYGANGGVGDETVNKIDSSPSLPITLNNVRYAYDSSTDMYSVSGKASANTSRAIGSISTPQANTNYTYLVIPESGYSYPPVYIWDTNSQTNLLSFSTEAIRTFTTLNSVTTVAVGVRIPSGATANYKFKILLVKGAYTPATMPPYEPYGYKIPVQMTTAQDTNTVKIYTDAPLGDGDVLTVNPRQSAMRNDTDVTDMQDWTQSWKVPKGVTGVTVDTTVQPSKFEI